MFNPDLPYFENQIRSHFKPRIEIKPKSPDPDPQPCLKAIIIVCFVGVERGDSRGGRQAQGGEEQAYRPRQKHRGKQDQKGK